MSGNLSNNYKFTGKSLKIMLKVFKQFRNVTGEM